MKVCWEGQTLFDYIFMSISVSLCTGVTWGKIVSLYAVAGALAVDCVRHGHPAMVHTIVDCMGEFVRKSLVSWLKRRGGWVRNKSINLVQLIWIFMHLIIPSSIILDSDWSFAVAFSRQFPNIRCRPSYVAHVDQTAHLGNWHSLCFLISWRRLALSFHTSATGVTLHLSYQMQWKWPQRTNF